MKARALFASLILSILLAACSSPAPPAAPATDAPPPAEELPPEEPTPTAETEAAAEADAPEVEFFAVEEAKTTLLVYAGEARVSHDDGESWVLADTGLWLESGDRLQISPGGLALILFPDGSLIRLEGFTDFELVLAEFDFETGTKKIIARVLDGAALVTTVPLPNPDSLFQLWVMTTLIDLPFQSDRAVALDGAEAVAEENRIAFGAAMREDLEGEFLFSYADSVLPDFYALELIDGDVVLIKTSSAPDQLTQFFLPFREDIATEFQLEAALDMAAGALAELKKGTDPTGIDFYGYTLFEEGALAEGQTLYSLLSVDEVEEFLEEAASDPGESQEFINYVSRSPAYKRYQRHYTYFKRIPDIFAPEILLQLEKYQMGCDITTGLGCAIPEGCDRETGEGCTFTSGCNIITREGCKRAYLGCIAFTNCDVMPCGRRPTIRHFCKPRVRTYCDPAVPGDCDQFLLSAAEQLALLEEQMDPSQTGDQTPSEGAEAGDSGQAGDDSGASAPPAPALPLELVQNPELAGQPLYDPNLPAGLEPFSIEDYWDQLMAYYREMYGDYEDDDWDDEEVEWCTCTAKVPPGYPPPPAWMDMTYRCWCSDPGAQR